MLILGILLGLLAAFSFQAYKYNNGPLVDLWDAFKKGFKDGLDAVKDRFK